MKVQQNKWDQASQYIHKINEETFADIALHLFQRQSVENKVYAAYIEALGIDRATVKDLAAIPFLPISFFKTHAVVSGSLKPEAALMVFESSGTTGENTSRHYIFRPELYAVSLLEGFRQFYGAPQDYVLLALLPSYLERKNASLVQMAKELMQHSGNELNGFFLDEWEPLAAVLKQMEKQGQKALLLGVTFALLDFAAAFPMTLTSTIIMETGGMKGRREEWTRSQVHEYLKQQWGLKNVHSEYGMTELLSQAYATENGIFHPSKTMKAMIREVNDPLSVHRSGGGCLNIIDLANVDSCAFIATEDMGIVRDNGSFEVLGRMDHAALRGCSLMTA